MTPRNMLSLLYGDSAMARNTRCLRLGAFLLIRMGKSSNDSEQLDSLL